MSKRGAEEYITKEHGSTPNDPSEGAKVKMATAAQLAKRKMAVPKSRAGRTGQSPMPGAGSSNPFASTNSFGASQSIQNPGGVTFGASQSFPPNSSNGGFSFSVPGQSSSFTFGQPTGSNPFATLNGDANSQPSGQESNDTIMESPQKKPAFGSSVFSSANGDQNAQSAGFHFGQSTNPPATQSGFSFGQTQGFGSATGAPSFGQPTSKPTESTSTTLFGQTTETQSKSSSNHAFGQDVESSQQTTPAFGFKFGQTATSAPPPASTFTFGQATTSTPGSSGFKFGQTVTSAPAPAAASTFSFGQSANKSSPNSLTTSGTSQTAQTGLETGLSESQPAPVSSSFGIDQSKNVFSGFGSSKPEGTTESNKNKAAEDEPQVNPFAGLFSQSQAKQAESIANPSTDVQKPLFGLPAPAQPTGLFAAPNVGQNSSTLKSVEDSSKKPLFSFGNPVTSTAPNTPPSTSSTVEAPPKPGNLFSGFSAKQAVGSDREAVKSTFEFPKTTSDEKVSGFQPMPGFGSVSASQKSSRLSTLLPPGFNEAKDSRSSAPSAGIEQIAGTESQDSTSASSGSSTSSNFREPISPSTDLFTKTAEAAAAVSSRESAGGEVSSAIETPKRTVNTYPPTRIPPYLNGDEYKAYDSNFRLHSLNREFQKHIASLDPSRNDFENIVRNYVAARESIGESIGLYTRNMAGMKRKSDTEDEPLRDKSASIKKPKHVDEPRAQNHVRPEYASESIFQPISPSSSSRPLASSNTIPSSVGFNASSIFSSMIPKSSNGSSSAAPGNPFANLSANGSASNPNPMSNSAVPISKPTSSSAQTNSTTPTRSPPKQSPIEMPKFLAPSSGINFMDAFKKQSDSNAAKFAKEAKEKRKAEDFDSDEDDEEEWNRKYEAEERAKKAKIEAITQKGFTPNLANGTSAFVKSSSVGSSAPEKSATSQAATNFVAENKNVGKSLEEPIDISDNDASGEDEEDLGSGESGNGDEDDENEGDDEDDLPEDEVDAEEDTEEDEDLETAMARSRSTGRSLFDRVTPKPDLQKGSVSALADKDFANKSSNPVNVFGKGNPDTTLSTPLTQANSKEPYIPSKTFNFTPTPPVASPTPVAGASIFAGGLVKDGPIAGEGLFGSRPSTPSNAEKSKTNVFSNLGTPSFSFGSDHTWKKGSEIKFGTSTTEPPSLSITEATPRKDESKPFGNLFGASASAPVAQNNANLGFNFGQSPAPGFLSAASHLAGGSGTNSGFSSRATSPGTTDNESVATNDEDYTQDAQVSLMENRPGEEDEKVLFENRARAMRHYNESQIAGTKLTKGWNSVGLGVIRLLKHRETGKTRLVMRAEPGANIILNTNLQAGVTYKYALAGNAGSITFSVIDKEGVQLWLMKLKTPPLAQDLAKLMEENKSSTS